MIDKIVHWKFETGLNCRPPDWVPKSIVDEYHWPGHIPAPRGWYCWSYVQDTDSFLYWMKENMKSRYDATPRFNSGDPVVSVYISDDEDATIFKLKWKHND